MALNPADSAFLQTLEQRLGPSGLRPAAPADLEEPRGRYHGQAGAVAIPRNTDDVATIVRAAAEARVGLVPRAGGTGLVGGQVAPEGPVPLLLSLERMTQIRSVDATDNVLVAEAGAILADVQGAAAGADRLFPLSLASEGSARIGGLLATNAGGVQVLRYGNARDLVLGLEAVLADGAVVSGLRRLRKDNTGYDLRHLLIGSEGTLGIITAASLRLFPQPAELATAWVTVPDPTAALHLFLSLREALGEALSAFELMSRMGLEFVADKLPTTPVPDPAPAGWRLLIEAGSGPGAALMERLETALGAALESGLASDALIAQNEAQRGSFWRVRETIPEANRLIGAVASHDISVPVAQVPAFLSAGAEALSAVDPSLRINAFGHLGDGNLHYNVFPAEDRDRDAYAGVRDEVTRVVHDLVAQHDGSISAEHGIGRLKVADLERYGDPTKLSAMRAIKAALDPRGILNPGAVLRLPDQDEG
ncbi:MAG: FAD-binding oxidoreductase [Pseudomonadota bacterium]